MHSDMFGPIASKTTFVGVAVAQLILLAAQSDVALKTVSRVIRLWIVCSSPEQHTLVVGLGVFGAMASKTTVLESILRCHGC